MTIKQFYIAVSEVKKYSCKNSYISDLSSSPIFCVDNSPNNTVTIDELSVSLGNIWNVVNMSVKDIRMTTGMSQADFHRKFSIPKRTLQNWEAGVRKCPEYTKLLLAAVCGLVEFGE